MDNLDNKSKKFELIIARLKRKLLFRTDKELAHAIGMSPTAFNGRKKTASIPYPEIIDYANCQNLDLNDLLASDGPNYNNITQTGPIYKGRDLEKEAPRSDSDPQDPPSQNDNLIVIEHQDIIKRFKYPERGLKINQKLIEILETNEDVFDNVESFINGAHQAVRSMKKTAKKIPKNG